MYINFWYPICTVDDLKDGGPLRTKVLGLRYVAFRDSQGAAHVLADTCVHRGGSLGRGKVTGDSIACPYHGWRYGGDGRCTHIPAQKEGQNPPARAKVDSYPVQEKYDVVFAFLGDLPEAERPPLFDIVEYGKEGWRASEVMILNIPCYYERSMENGLDPVHNEFVHPLQGNPQVNPDDIVISDMPWGSRVYAPMGEPRRGTTRMADLRGDPKDLGAASWHVGPNQLVTSINLSAENNLTQYFFEAPVDRWKTKIYFINMRNCWPDPDMDDKIKEINLSITAEDIGILEELYPVRTPETTTREILSPGDECVVKFRACLRDWQARGWRMDTGTLEANDGDVAYAIPCPDRRTSGNWVLDPVPLMPAQQAVAQAREG